MTLTIQQNGIDRFQWHRPFTRRKIAPPTEELFEAVLKVGPHDCVDDGVQGTVPKEHEGRKQPNVSQHIHIESPGNTVDLEGVRISDTEQDYFKRGIKEAIYIRALQPSLNRDGGRYRLQTTFDPLLTSHVGKITCPQHLGQIAEED
ncbi:hypothetical protein Bbelb_071850 [Branchiostoma belcheri]|nr:hypothetical protein Bbelb_071850 [Branchiostoma belcheri]